MMKTYTKDLLRQAAWQGDHVSLRQWLTTSPRSPLADCALATELLQSLLSYTTYGIPADEIDVSVIIDLSSISDVNVMAPVRNQIMGPTIPIAMSILRFAFDAAAVGRLLAAVSSSAPPGGASNPQSPFNLVYGRDASCDEPGITFLEYAVRVNNVAAVREILRHGVGLQWPAGDDDRHHAAKLAKIDDAAPAATYSALHVACGAGCSTDILSALLEAGASVNAANTAHSWERGRTPLLNAAASGRAGERQVDCIKWLIEHGADAGAVDSEGANVLHIAAGSGSSTPDAVWSILIAAVPSAALHAKRSNDGCTPVQAARQSYSLRGLLHMARAGGKVLYMRESAPPSIGSGGSASAASPCSQLECVLSEAATLHFGPEESPLSAGEWTELVGRAADEARAFDAAGAAETTARSSLVVAQLAGILTPMLVAAALRGNTTLLDGVLDPTAALLASLSDGDRQNAWPAKPSRPRQPVAAAAAPFVKAVFQQRNDEETDKEVSKGGDIGGDAQFWASLVPSIPAGAAVADNSGCGQTSTFVASASAAPSMGQVADGAKTSAVTASAPTDIDSLLAFGAYRVFSEGEGSADAAAQSSSSHASTDIVDAASAADDYPAAPSSGSTSSVPVPATGDAAPSSAASSPYPSSATGGHDATLTAQCSAGLVKALVHHLDCQAYPSPLTPMVREWAEARLRSGIL